MALCKTAILKNFHLFLNKRPFLNENTENYRVEPARLYNYEHFCDKQVFKNLFWVEGFKRNIMQFACKLCPKYTDVGKRILDFLIFLFRNSKNLKIQNFCPLNGHLI